jgi:hypothetical protein
LDRLITFGASVTGVAVTDRSTQKWYCLLFWEPSGYDSDIEGLT